MAHLLKIRLVSSILEDADWSSLNEGKYDLEISFL
jgi:hypothetical protein